MNFADCFWASRVSLATLGVYDDWGGRCAPKHGGQGCNRWQPCVTNNTPETGLCGAALVANIIFVRAKSFYLMVEEKQQYLHAPFPSPLL